MLLIIGAVLLASLTTKSLPETEGTLDVAGLSADVEVWRDELGVPHIIASSEYDAYLAAGYVHAQDRLWQMDLLRRYGAGRLAEILGAEALPVDRLMRTIGIHHIADSLLHTVSAQTRRILEAYSRGVNACMRESAGRYPIEFDLLQYEPEAWTPQHSLILARLMGWELALSWWVDLTMGELRSRLGENTARDLFPDYPDDAPRILPPDFPVPAEAAALLRDGRRDAQRLFGIPGSATGSNSWVVSPAHTVAGGVLLANDPHLLHMQPARWYVMHLSAPGLNVAGVSLPGIPGIVIGQNERIAWGLTNMMTDDVDFFFEDVNMRDSTYRLGEQLFPLQMRDDSILVRDSLPTVIQIVQTAHGPVISDVYPRAGVIAAARRFEERRAVSMRWAGQDASDEILAIYRLNHAASWEQMLEAMTSFGVPGQNLLYGDVDGNIGYTAIGRIPIRQAGVSPLFPSDGSAIERPWTGYVPYARLPRSYNPDGGMFATANNKIVDDFPWHISSLWESEARVTRIREMLSRQPTFSAEDFMLMQMDVQSATADSIRDAMVGALRAWPSRPVLLTRVMNRLAAWDCRMHVSSTEAAIYNTAYMRLLHNTFGDEMDSTLFNNYVFLSNIPTRVLPRLLHDTATTIFDDIRTPRRETRQHILIRSVTEAVTQLRQRFGIDMPSWQWGAMHTVTFRHPLGDVTPLDRIFNIGPLRVGGNNTTVNNGEFSFTDPYDAAVGPSMRFVADLSAPDSSHIIITTGQSGQPFSDHYADQAVLWQSGAMHRLVLRTDVIRRSSWKRLLLRAVENAP
ncbi:MAG: penicillin acylase family protein [Bacteroidota bacterium]|nr:penicillin acylase family protein [Bacteroidota bacterium]